RDGAPAGWDNLRAHFVGSCGRDENRNVLWHTGRPSIYCFSTCVDSIRTIPLMQWDPDKPGDIISDGVEDHLIDNWRYAVQSRPFPLQVESVERIPHVKGIHSTLMRIVPPP